MTAAAPPAFRPPQIAAILLAGVVGVLIAGLQPQLLGALATEGRLSAAQLGLVATVELLTMGLAAGAAGALLKPVRLRTITASAAITLAAIDMVTPLAGAAGIIALRALAGIASGVLIWIAIGMIVRMAAPARWSGIYLALQTLAQLVLATVFARIVIPAHGADGGFVGLALVSLLPLLALAWVPPAYAPLPKSDAPGGLPAPTGFAALISVTLYLAFIVGVWVYIEPLALQSGIDPGTIAAAVPLSLGMQVLGAAVAASIATRVPALPVIGAVSVANLAILFALGSNPGGAMLLICAAAFGFLWLFVLPFQVAIVIAADSTRRAAMLIAGAQLLGSSLGPLFAAMTVSDRDVRGTLWLGAVCIAASILILIALQLRQSPINPATQEFQ